VSVSVVLPTYNRCRALRATIGDLFLLRGVAEVVVVDDGSTDATPELLGSLREPALRPVRLARNRGTPAARNAGAATARSRWLLFAEDDCRFPPDYATVLLDEAHAQRAQVVGAPMVHPGPDEELGRAVQRARAAARGPGRLDEVSGFPVTPTVTPMLPAPVLVERALVAALGFDEDFGGNAYREETDFFLRAARTGARCVLTPRTYFWERERFSGGSRSRVPGVDEYWRIRNNWRFLRRHAGWLEQHGYIDSPVREQARFAWRRMHELGCRAIDHAR
jgi:GT2 family glycosyltransferase